MSTAAVLEAPTAAVVLTPEDAEATRTLRFQVQFELDCTLDYLVKNWQFCRGYATEDEANAALRALQVIAAGQSRMIAYRVVDTQPEPIYMDSDAAANAIYWEGRARAARAQEAAMDAMFELKGKRVVAVTGRKVKVGTEAECFWVGEGNYGMRLGLKLDDGSKVFAPAHNFEEVTA